ncbi:MAG: transglutaminase domain-containing protein [Actinobacteria bacterium]|nr:transglutaminase domain-containing protein [Actinomycetota bacterium]
MRNKKIILISISLIICLIFIVFTNTGCLYKLGKSMGEQLKSQATNTSNSSSDNSSSTQETVASTENSGSDYSSSTTELSSTTYNTQAKDSNESTTELSSTTYNTQTKDSNENSGTKNEIQVSFDMDYKFNISGNVSDISFIVIIPKDYKDRQKIINSQYSIKPERVFDDGPNTYAEFIINNPTTNFELNIMDEIVLSQYGLDTAFNAGNKDFDAKDLDKYLAAEKYIEKDDEEIIKTAGNFEGEDTYVLVQAIYDYVMENMEWVEYVPEDVGAKVALIEKRGDCTSYSDLFIALLRAKGIPARIVEGYTIDATDLNVGHNWVEVYFNDIGWVPFDPTYDDNNGSTSLFNNLNNIYVYFSLKRNDLILNGFHFFSYNWHGDGQVEVTKNISVN